MAAKQSKSLNSDLKIAAKQLANIKIDLSDQNSALTGTATFNIATFDTDSYQVSIGVRHAILRLSHPGYEIDQLYKAHLPKKVWSERQTNTEKKGHPGIKFLPNFGKRIISTLGGKERISTTETTINPLYPIVTAVPDGWEIGTYEGDPRHAAGTFPDGLENCLRGEYLCGHGGEEGEGLKRKDGSYALCILQSKQGANDQRIIATLFGRSGSLEVAVNPLGRGSGFMNLGEFVKSQ